MSPTPVLFFKKTSNNDINVRYRRSILPNIKIGPTTMGVITVVIILLMSLLYLIQANSTATKGYEIEKEQEKIRKLESQAEKLELEMAKLRSTKELNSIPEKLNLKPLPEFSEENQRVIHFETNETLAGIDGIETEKQGFNPNR